MKTILTRPNWIMMIFGQVTVLGGSISFAQIADPVVSITASAVSSPQTATVTATDTTPGAVIHYTTDGTAPLSSSPSIASGVSVLLGQNETLKTQAYVGTTGGNTVSSKFTSAGMVSAGARHTLILKSDQSVWASGDNTYGELGNGDGTGTAKTYPVQVMKSSGVPLTAIICVAAGTDESFAVDSSGNVWAWGYNPNGQLGNGATANALYATQVTALSNCVGIASSQYHSLALKSTGAVYGWGADGNGQVGNGTTATWVTTPAQVNAANGGTGYLGGIVAVAAGANHSLAIDNTGKVWAWGSNASGQLGNGDITLTTKTSPVQVLSNGVALASIVGVSANSTDSFALKSDGTMWAWGDNSTGQLGNGTLTASLSAVQVRGLPGLMIAAGSEASLDSSGNVWTWGSNANAQLGIGYTGYFGTLPLEVSPLATFSPTLTATVGNGQTVLDGTYSAPFTITATNGGTPAPGAWVNMITSPTTGFLGLASGAVQLSPIIGGLTGANGQISFYLVGSSSGSVPLTAASGTSQINLSAIEIPTGNAGPVGYWSLNEGSGTTTADLSGNANNGTLVNAPTWVTGALNNALSFDGTSSYLTLNNSSATGALKPALPITVSAWIKITASTTNPVIYASDNWNSSSNYAGFSFQEVSGVLNCGFGDGGGTGTTHRRSKAGTTVLSTGQWYHVAAVIQGPTSMSLYVNGVEDGGVYSGTGGAITYTSTASKIGSGGTGAFFNGSVDDLRVYSRALSAAEISLLANGPTSNWRLDELSGTTSFDSGIAGVTGTFINSPTTVAGWLGNALNFNGTSSYVNMNNASATGPLKVALPVTVSAWIKPSTTSNQQAIFSSDNFDTNYYGYDIKLVSGVLACDYGGGGANNPAFRRSKSGTSVLTPGQWYHVAAVIQGATSMNLYVNGVDDGGSYSGTGGTMQHSTTPSKIGTDGTVNFFNGVIDDVRVYGRALSPAEIGILDNAGNELIAPE